MLKLTHKFFRITPELINVPILAGSESLENYEANDVLTSICLELKNVYGEFPSANSLKEVGKFDSTLEKALDFFKPQSNPWDPINKARVDSIVESIEDAFGFIRFKLRRHSKTQEKTVFTEVERKDVECKLREIEAKLK